MRSLITSFIIACGGFTSYNVRIESYNFGNSLIICVNRKSFYVSSLDMMFQILCTLLVNLQVWCLRQFVSVLTKTASHANKHQSGASKLECRKNFVAKLFPRNILRVVHLNSTTFHNYLRDKNISQVNDTIMLTPLRIWL